MSDFDKAIELALRTWYPEDHPLHNESHHPLGKLLGEWGELLDDYMKSLYKPGYVFEPEDELGDIWYYIRILAYQRDFIPEVSPHKDNGELLELLIAIIMNEVSFAFLGACKGFAPNNEFITFSYSLLLRICSRYNLTLDQITASNWEKLKPGSERGDEWQKARVSTDYARGKIAIA